jgi:hypothetical protein
MSADLGIAPAPADAAHRFPVIDFRYAPRSRWTLICRPFDRHKSLVREDGALLYGFRKLHHEAWLFERVVALRAQTDDAPLSVEQTVESPRRAIVTTTITYPRQTLTLTTFAHVDSDDRRSDVTLWRIEVHADVDELLTGLHLDVHDRERVYAPPGQAPAHAIRSFPEGAEPRLGIWPDDTASEDGGEATAPIALVSSPQRVLRAHTTGFVPASGLATLPEVLRGGEVTEGAIIVALDDGAADHLRFDDARAALAKTRRFWDELPLSHAVLEVPDPAVMDVLTAAARNLLQAAEQVGGLPVLQVGPTVYRGLWIVDGHFILEAARYLGWHESADAGIQVLLRRVKPDGSITEMVSDPHIKETAVAVFTLVRQHELRDDDEGLRALWPTVRRAVEHVAALNREAEALPAGHPLAGLMPEAFADGGVGGRRAELTTTIWTLAGLRSAARAAQRLELPGRDDITELYDRLDERFRERARQLRSVTPDGLPYLPMIPSATGLHSHHFHHRIADEVVGRQHRIQPESATWALCQAIWPGEILPPDHEIVADLLALLDSRDDEEGIPLTTGWLPYRALWSYAASFTAHAWLYAGRGDKAADYLYTFANHAAPTMVWREEHSVTGSGHGQICGDMPHNWASAEFVRLVRHLLVFEVGDGLQVLPGVPDTWLHPGAHIRALATPTRFGPVDLDARVDVDGAVRLDLALAGTGQSPASVRLRLPGAFTDVTVNGEPGSDGGWIALPVAGRIHVTARRPA